MYLIYVDESGTPRLGDGTDFYILASFIIHEYKWDEVKQGISLLKAKLFPEQKNTNFEFHMSDIAHRSGIFSKKSKTELFEIIREVFNYISSLDCTIICVAIKKNQVVSEKKIDFISLRYLMERFEKNIEEKNKNKMNKDFGLIIMDRISQEIDYKRTKKIRNVRKQINQIYGKDSFIFEDPIFVDSQYRDMIQIADAIAFCAQRVLRKNEENIDEKTQLFLECFELIKCKFATNSLGEIEGAGLKVFPSEDERKKFLER